MENCKKRLLLFTSSHKTPRIYLNLLKDYLQVNMPESDIDYFISQHDNDSIKLQDSSIIESRQIDNSTDIIIGLDGYLPRDILKEAKAKKVLLYLPEEGNPFTKKRYLSGYDYLATFSSRFDSMFLSASRRGNVTILKDVEDIFKTQMQDKMNIELAKKSLYSCFPQIKGKRILSIVSRGICSSKYLERYKKIDLKGLLNSVPDDVVIMTNCRQIQLAGTSLPCSYIDKFVAFGQNNLIDVISASNWAISNMGIIQKSAARWGILVYNENGFEKYNMNNKGIFCFEPNDNFVKQILEFIDIADIPEEYDHIQRRKFTDILAEL